MQLTEEWLICLHVGQHKGMGFFPSNLPPTSEKITSYTPTSIEVLQYTIKKKILQEVSISDLVCCCCCLFLWFFSPRLHKFQNVFCYLYFIHNWFVLIRVRFPLSQGIGQEIQGFIHLFSSLTKYKHIHESKSAVKII